MNTMVLSAMLTFLVHLLIVSRGVVSSDPPREVLDLPWETVLCCASPPSPAQEGGPENNRSGEVTSDNGPPHTPPCHFWNSTSTTQPALEAEPSRVGCLDILCLVDGEGENVICNLKPLSDISTSGPVAISWHLLPSEENMDVNSTDGTDPISCVAQDSLTCSMPLRSVTSVVMVTVKVADASSPPVMLSVPPRPGKPDPPVNLTHSQTTEGELILSWTLPQSNAGPLRYEVRYSHSTSHPNWERVEVGTDPWVSLSALRHGLEYRVQVRCHTPALPHRWSDWSQPHHIYLHNVSYISEKVVASPGDSVTIYCVINDLSVNASSAIWWRNLQDMLPQSLAVNDRVSKITVRPSEGRMYDTLHCCQGSRCDYAYAQIYIRAASIDIRCVTNGDLDAMTCRWNSSHWSGLSFLSRWDDLSCEGLEGEERESGTVSVVREVECQFSGQKGVKSCTHTLKSLRLFSCYKLWLELETEEGSVGSRPVYITPMEHVKPHPPSGLKAESLPSGVLRVEWVAPYLPVYDLQYEVRYSTAERLLPKWKVVGPLSDLWTEVPVPDVCRVYRVQARCLHANGSGYWSDWSEPLFSSPHNSRAPDQGPDFWRVLREDPARNQTNVTLLFRHSPIVEPFCVEGLVVQHRASGGAVTVKRIELVSSYMFEWREEVHTVTVKAQNSLGSSSRNVNMTLDRHNKRQCVRSFSASVVNSSCLALSWALHPNSTAPWSMVVEWSAQNPPLLERSSQASEGRGGWIRVPFTNGGFYLHGDFYGSEEYELTLYPVFADGEGEPVYTTATRGDPAAYMLLMIIAFLFIVLFVTLVVSQNHVKKLMWKDVPNPNNCSWAQGLDFRRADTMEQLFRHPEGLPAWPLLLVSETISEAVIVEKIGPPASSPAQGKDAIKEGAPTQDPSPSPTPCMDSAGPGLLEETSADLHRLRPPVSDESSAQSSVTYATVLLADPPGLLLYKQGGGSGGSSSSDEGNFSANNSDISGSFNGRLWELENSRAVGEMDPRRSCSYNSVEEFSETSEQEDEAPGGREKDLYYLGAGCQEEGEGESEEEEEEEEEEREEDTEVMLLKEVALDREGSSVESNPLLGRRGSRCGGAGEAGPGSESGMKVTPLYLPQFRTAPAKPLRAKARDSTP